MSRISQMKPLTECANGDGRPVCPPSKVICRECMDKIGENLRAMLSDWERKEKELREKLTSESERLRL